MAKPAKRVRPTTGIDIGTGFLKMVDFDGTQITGARVVALPDNLIRDGHIVSHEEFIRALRQASVTHRDCALMLYSSVCYTRRVQMPAMSTKELMLNLPYEFQDFIQEGDDDYRFDYALLEMKTDEQGTPSEMDLLAAMVKTSVMNDLSACFKKAGLRLSCAAPDVMAFTNIVRKAPDPESDFCFVNMGTTGTRVYLFPRGRFEVIRNIDFGTDNIVRVVARELNIDHNLARTYVTTNHEHCQELPAVHEAIEAFVAEIQRIVNFYNFSFRDSSLECLHYGGTASQVKPLVDALSSTLTVELRGVSDLLPAAAQVNRDVLLQCPAAAGIVLA